jgi:hypothetical protein
MPPVTSGQRRVNFASCCNVAFALFAVPLFAEAARAADEITFFVDASGNDTWSGRIAQPDAAGNDGPFATIHRAQQALRSLRRDGRFPGPVTIRIRGTHRLTQPLVLTPEDSGSAATPVTFTGYPDEKPLLSGGRLLTGWRPGEDGRWHVEIPEARDAGWPFRQLFVNGSRRRPARAPNQGYYRIAQLLPGPPIPNSKPIARDRFFFTPGDLQPWQRLEDVQVVLMHSWETSIHPLRTIDTQTNIVEFAAPMREWWSIGHWEAQPRYYVENAFELLDDPGQWYLNQATGVLSYQPLADERLESIEAIAPVLTELVRLDGDPDQSRFVDHVSLRGLRLQHADWVLAPQGNSSTQAAVTVPAAVMATGARHCVLKDCEIAHVGTYGVWFGRGCKYNRIEQNHLHDLGAGGIRIGEPQMADNGQAEASHNLVTNNYIHDGGHVYAAGVGLWLAQSSHNIISHNEIHSFDYSGISVGWNWNDAPNRTHHNTIEYNHVHHVIRGVLSDAGGIYTLGVQPGTVIRNNVFHDIWPYMGNPAMAWGIYFDQGSSGMLAENNIVYHTLTGGLMNTGSSSITVRNNIFAHSAWQAVWRWHFQKEPPSVVERNIFYLTQGELFHHDGGRTDNRSHWDHNLYWRTDGQPLEFYGESFSEWQARGIDQNSLVADPRFVDPDRFDFRLQPDSPARKLGFVPIDTSSVGLQGPSEWRDLPKQAEFPATILPPPPAPPEPIRLDDGFETTPVGQPPAQAMVIVEGRGDTVQVTADTAASGQRSLKIVDADDLQHAFNPHFFYQPHFRNGRAILSFDVRLEPGAQLAHEWRDARSPYRTGPSIRLEAGGKLTAQGRHLTDVPAGEWFRIQIETNLGKQSTGTYDLTITVPGKSPQIFANLVYPGSPLERLEWLGFVSLAQERTTIYLDNIHLQQQ